MDDDVELHTAAHDCDRGSPASMTTSSAHSNAERNGRRNPSPAVDFSMVEAILLIRMGPRGHLLCTHFDRFVDTKKAGADRGGHWIRFDLLEREVGA